MVDASGCCFDKECMMKCVGLMLVRGESCVLQVEKSVPYSTVLFIWPTRPMHIALEIFVLAFRLFCVIIDVMFFWWKMEAN